MSDNEYRSMFNARHNDFPSDKSSEHVQDDGEEDESERLDSENNASSASDDNIMQNLYDALDNIGDTQFAAFGAVPDFVDPQLIVDPCGPIKFPLNDVDASRIIAASHQAPFGKGERTIIDTSVRRTWELNRDQFTIRNSPGFDAVVSRAVEAACTRMGIMGQPGQQRINAHLYKMLLYEKGALFRPHTEYVSWKVWLGQSIG